MKKEAVVIGSGPNGLSAAIVLARAGVRVTVHEAEGTIGGGARSAELTLPGFVHDVCSAVHPMAVGAPVFERFPLHEYGLEWIHPEAPVAHPLDDGTAVMLERSMDATAANLGRDGEAWRKLFEPLTEAWPRLRQDALMPLVRVPRHPFLMAKLGLNALRPVRQLAYAKFKGERARALFAGIAGHSMMPFEAAASSAIGVVMTVIGHTHGWPLPRGGAQSITNALAGYLRNIGGEIRAGSRVTQLPGVPLVMCDVTPRQLLAIGGQRFPRSFRRSLERYRYGPGVFKMDWALDGPIPWRAKSCMRAATVHVGGTFEEIATWERDYRGRPFVLVTQPSLFDGSRTPEGKHTAWGYCHLPNGSTEDMSGEIESQIERFAPGFRGRILARHIFTPAGLERRNANIVGGDINGGALDLQQMFFRPTPRIYGTPLDGVYICSASTPPGGGVHGVCGYNAAQLALKNL